jgi:uncharacterized DUF497 family protein
MEFEFNPDKSVANQRKHGIDFVVAQALWSDAGLLILPSRNPDEPRFLAIGRIDQQHWTAIFTERGERVRLISGDGRGSMRRRSMSKTNRKNLEQRFETDEDVLDYFEAEVVLTIQRLAELAPILNLSALAREAGINVQTLQAKIRRRTPLSGMETKGVVSALKKHHLTTVA